MTTEEIALEILCAQIKSGKDIGNVSVREAFALAITFEEQAIQVREGRRQRKPFPASRPTSGKLSYDDDGL